MQWAEFILWIDIKNNPKEITKLNYSFAKIIIPLILAFQPIANVYGMYLCNTGIPKYVLYIYFIYSISVFILLSYYSTYVKAVESKNFGNYLQWSSNDTQNYSFIWKILILFHMILFILPTIMYCIREPLVQKSIASGLIVAIVSYLSDKSLSRWCLYINIWSIIWLFEN